MSDIGAAYRTGRNAELFLMLTRILKSASFILCRTQTPFNSQSLPLLELADELVNSGGDSVPQLRPWLRHISIPFPRLSLCPLLVFDVLGTE